MYEYIKINKDGKIVEWGTSTAPVEKTQMDGIVYIDPETFHLVESCSGDLKVAESMIKRLHSICKTHTELSK